MPMQGPHALAKTLAPILSNFSMNPSRSIVNRTCSDPGVIVNSDLVFNPLLATCSARLAALAISSYDELVHEPIRPTSTRVGQPFLAASSRILEIGVARSGVNGPLRWGSSSLRLISTI